MRHLFAATLALILATTLPVRAAEPADAIQGVIVSQIDALQANDLAAAFAHASPMIQTKFGTPENFGRMVREGYPMIWRPSHYEMRELLQTGGSPVQPVLIQDQAGRLYEAFYEMLEVDGVWRINGVQLRQLPGVGS